MKKVVSETIDGSIKNIIQLKTLDSSLEFSQMFDALQDCPPEFQAKLVESLNSLAQTMGIPPTETFNKVLCKSDEDEDVKKKLYNWWRSVFEILSKCKIPKERMDEFNEKVDDLMAEILKAGDGAASKEELIAEEYEQATKDDEDAMLADMKFAIGKIGEIANKVQDLINFVNPYCGTEVNESGDQPKFKIGDVVRVMNLSGMDFYGRDAPIGPIVKIQPPHPDVGVYEYLIKGRSGEFFAYEDELELLPEKFTEENGVMDKPGRYGIGDHVLYKGEECVVTDVDEDLRNDEEIYQVSRDSDKVDGLSFNDWATWDELEPVEGFTEEVKNTMKFNKIDERAGGDSDEWVSMDDIVGMRVGEETDEALDDNQFHDHLMSMKPLNGDIFENYDVYNIDNGMVELNVLVNKPRVSYAEVEQRYAPIAKNAGWKFVSFAYADKDDTVVAGNDDMCAINVKFKPMSQVNEARVVVDANDVWDVLDLLDNDIAKKELTDLINSHSRTEEEIMDAINELSGDTISKNELNTLISGKMSTIVDFLGLDVERYEDTGDFVDSDKPTSVELEGTDLKDITEKLTSEELADSIDGWEDSSKKLVVCDAYASGSEIVNVDVLTLTDKRDEIMKMANDYLLGNVENWQIADASEPRKDENGQFYTELILEPKYEEVSENNDEVKDGEKQVTQDGETKTLVAGEEKKPVCEMTIEQEIDDPWKLYELLWGQGKENLRDLLESELVDEELLMQCLEDMETRNLTSINDVFAFDFPSILDMLGLDGQAWSQNLEIKRKGDDSED